MKDDDLIQDERTERDRHDLPTARGDGGRPGPIARDSPYGRTEDPTAIERETRDHVEGRKVEIDRPEVTRDRLNRLGVR